MVTLGVCAAGGTTSNSCDSPAPTTSPRTSHQVAVEPPVAAPYPQPAGRADHVALADHAGSRRGS